MPSSGDIAFGNIVFLNDNKKVTRRKIKDTQVKDEIAKLNLSIKDLEKDFNDISNELNFEYDNLAEMYQLNILILNDPEIFAEIVSKIKTLCSAAYAVEFIFNRYIKQLRNANDILLSERAELFEEIKNLLLNKLLVSGKNNFRENDIIVAKNVESNLLFKFKLANIAGFVCQDGGLTSHTAIIARAFNIPSIINVKNLINSCKRDDFAIIDAIDGKFIINPEKQIFEHYFSLKQELEVKKQKLLKILSKESKTLDNKRVLVKSNLDNLIELNEYNLLNSDGIGLIRTEVLFNIKDVFNENKQTEYYTQISKKLYPKEVTIRIFDIGSDKYPDGFKFKENNPALGVRGIRFLFQNVTILRKQIRAILKSSELKNIRILVPMISNLEDVRKTLALINEVKEDLSARGIIFDSNIKIGFMIETPSAAFLTKEICEYADFLSIGTNDLCQYLFAADRTNKDTSGYLNNNSPVLIKIIKLIVQSAHSQNTNVSICGEIAYNEKLTKLLVGTGVDELSLSFANIPNVKNELVNSNYEECQKMLEDYIEA